MRFNLRKTYAPNGGRRSHVSQFSFSRVHFATLSWILNVCDVKDPLVKEYFDPNSGFLKKY